MLIRKQTPLTKNNKGLGGFQVLGDPHPWPRDDKTPISKCAVIVIDTQHDYCSSGFYMDKAGYDIGRLSKIIEPIKQVLVVARYNGMKIIYTRYGRPIEPEPKTNLESTVISTFPQTAAYGEEGWQIVPELIPDKKDKVIDKVTCSAFISGELNKYLHEHNIKHLVFCGNTIDVCVHSTLRSAVDLNYESLLLEDCCGAVNNGLHQWAIESIKIENGVFGTVSDSQTFINALS